MNHQELEGYILDEHTTQLRSLREKVHDISNILLKDQHLVESLIENNKKLVVQLEVLSERVNKLEDINKLRESRLSLLKQSLKFWPIIIFILMIVDYSKLLEAIKAFFHLG